VPHPCQTAICRAGADDHHLDLIRLLAHHPQSVEKRRQHDDRRAVLVVMEDRDVQLATQG
jgi:hypothetical protein